MRSILTIAAFIVVSNVSFSYGGVADSALEHPNSEVVSNRPESHGVETSGAVGFTPGIWQTGFEMPNGCSWRIQTMASDADGMLYLGGIARACGNVPGVLYSYDPAANAFSSLGDFTNPGGFAPSVTDISIEGNHLYVVGRFQFVDGIEVNHIARYELSSGTWSSLGIGDETGITGGSPSAVEADANDVYVGFRSGNDSRVGTLDVNTIARWDISGEAWSAMSGGVVLSDALNPTRNVASVYDLALVDGTLYVGGSFLTAGGAPIESVAAFEPGAGWSQLGTGIEGVVVAVESDGTKVYAATIFSVFEFDGTDWNTIVSSFGRVGTVLALPNSLLLTDGSLYLGGWFSAVDDFEARNVARFNLSTRVWESLGSGMDNGVAGSVIGFFFRTAVDSLVNLGDDIYISGSLTRAGNKTINNIARWNATSNVWAPIGASVGKGVNAQDIWALATDGREVLTAGPLTQSGLEPTRWVGRFDIAAGAWSAFGDDSTRDLLGITSRIAFAGGEVFANVSQGLTDGIDSLSEFATVNGVVRWDAAAQDWAAMGPAHSPGLTSGGSGVTALRMAGGADALYVSGMFSRAGDIAADYIARWDVQGQTWSAMGAGLVTAAQSLAVGHSGDVYVGGRFSTAGGVPAQNAAMWDPATGAWSALGAGISNADGSLPNIEAIVSLLGGDVVFAGRFDTAGTVEVNNIARWDGTQWHPLGDGLTLASGDLAIVGALAASPAGEVYAGGNFDQSGTQPLDQIARWDGSAWSAVGPSIAESKVEGDSVDGIAVVGPDVFIAGDFGRVGGVVAANFAHFIRDLGGPELNLAVTGSSPGVGQAAFQIVIENIGDNNAFGMVLASSVAPPSSDVIWTCAAFIGGRARCPQAAGNGVPELVVDLPSNDGLRFDVLVNSAPETLFQDIHFEAETTSMFGDPRNFSAMASGRVAVSDEAVFKSDFEF